MNTLDAYILQQTGMVLSDAKRPVILRKVKQRLAALGLSSMSAYLKVVQTDEKEHTDLINSVTINETYFFREMQHFEFLNTFLETRSPRSPMRVWSAASSVGAEAYSLAMILSRQHTPCEIIGSDINTDVLKTARLARYPMTWADKIPKEMKKRYCLKGKGRQKGWFIVVPELVKQVRFLNRNLLFRHPDLGAFDFIFLRNVLFYFTPPFKRKVLNYALESLKINGYLVTSSTEHIFDLGIENIRQKGHAIYQKVK